MEKEKQIKQESYEAPAIEIIDIEVEQNIMSGSDIEHYDDVDW